ncbi:hypothetical protein [Asanoa hainanensis]|uniref:hypothetical protein n=1 Tax=Asanoa hainanensis TaxID=560556 RepID=UPI0015C5FB18|nr:hypothetical protein [Asanoa hainanensis]
MTEPSSPEPVSTPDSEAKPATPGADPSTDQPVGGSDQASTDDDYAGYQRL